MCVGAVLSKWSLEVYLNYLQCSTTLYNRDECAGSQRYLFSLSQVSTSFASRSSQPIFALMASLL